MKTHTGSKISPGKVSTYSTSVRQNLNMWRSEEFKLVVMYDVMPMVLWSKYLLEAQVYSVDTRISQDNQSSMILDKNGTASSRKRNRHIKIRHFYGK